MQEIAIVSNERVGHTDKNNNGFYCILMRARYEPAGVCVIAKTRPNKPAVMDDKFSEWVGQGVFENKIVFRK
jgi:hypothetical protein